MGEPNAVVDESGWKQSPRRFPCIRFSVRSLMVIVLILGGSIGWVERARVQREAVSAIERTGGSVSYDVDWIDGTYVVNDTSWPQWLTDALGRNYLESVTRVKAHRGVGDAEMRHIGRLKRLVAAADRGGRRDRRGTLTNPRTFATALARPARRVQAHSSRPAPHRAPVQSGSS